MAALEVIARVAQPLVATAASVPTSGESDTAAAARDTAMDIEVVEVDEAEAEALCSALGGADVKRRQELLAHFANAQAKRTACNVAAETRAGREASRSPRRTVQPEGADADDMLFSGARSRQ